MPLSSVAAPREAVRIVPKAAPERPLLPYLLGARWQVALSSPLIYMCALPFSLLDLFVSLYQAACFPIYGIPVVSRGRYFSFDRASLPYLNLLERFNCLFCSYANGVIGYVAEVTARTEQHWCPIKHAHEPERTHSRYARFLPHGEAQAYGKCVKDVRRDYADIKQ